MYMHTRLYSWTKRLSVWKMLAQCERIQRENEYSWITKKAGAIQSRHGHTDGINESHFRHESCF